jgi:hypothetical protein
MAWTAPMTAVANTAFTAAQFNTYIRDNLLETAPAKATAGVGNGAIFVKSATNTIAARLPDQASVSTSQSTSSGSYVNLSTVGPAVTVTTGTRALVIVSASIQNNSTNSSYVGIAVTGATSIAATDDQALRTRDSSGGAAEMQMSYAYLFTTLTAGSNTFTAKYRTNGGTSTYRNRTMTVLPL